MKCRDTTPGWSRIFYHRLFAPGVVGVSGRGTRTDVCVPSFVFRLELSSEPACSAGYSPTAAASPKQRRSPRIRERRRHSRGYSTMSSLTRPLVVAPSPRMVAIAPCERLYRRCPGSHRQARSASARQTGQCRRHRTAAPQSDRWVGPRQRGQHALNRQHREPYHHQPAIAQAVGLLTHQD